MKITVHYSFLIVFSLSLVSFSERDSVELEETISFYSGLKYRDVDLSKEKITSISQIKTVQNSPFFKSKCYSILGEIFRLKADYDSAQFYLEEALTIREFHGYDLYAGSTHELIARLYGEMGEDSTALFHLRKSLRIKEKIGNPDYLKSLYTSLGNFHLNLSHYDSAQFYFYQASEIYFDQNDSSGIATSYTSLGNLNYNRDYYDEAIKNYRDSYRFYQGSNQSIAPLLNIGVCYYEMGQNDSALFYYKEALKTTEKSGNNEYLDYIFISLAETYTELNQPDSAVSMFEYYIAYRDSIFKQDKVNALLEYETEYQTKEAKQQAAFEKEEREKIQAQDANKRKTIYILFFAILLLVLIAMFILRNIRQKSKLSALEIDVKNQEIDNLLKEQEAKSYASLLEGQNVERERIAQDLHDRLGGTLAAVKIHFNLMDQKIEELQSENRDLFDKVNGMLTDAVQDVRRISHDLASGRLSKLGLKGAISDLANILNTAKKLEVDFFMDDSIPNLGEKKEQEIYAIIQELVSNTLKHANATAVELQLNNLEGSLNIMFEDDGVGFVMDDAQVKGLGISGLNNRVKRLKGTINYDSVVGRGTIIIINIPL